MPSELAAKLNARRDALGQTRAVVLPDLYVDHLVPIEGRQRLRDGMDRLIRQGGGNMITQRHRIQLGGNAANTACALAGLGVPTTLIAPTNRLGLTLYQDATANLPAPTDAILPAQDASSTVALELDTERANVMISSPGPLATFGPANLTENAWARIEAADALAVTNWAQTLQHGTKLLNETLPRARDAGAFTFLDTGDPAHRGQDAHALLTRPGPLDALDAWGLNEHEARWFASRITDQSPDTIQVNDAARILDEHVPARIDVHTSKVAFSTMNEQTTEAKTFPITPQRLTGAGDAWNAGNLAATLLDLDAADRLRFANAVAALTISRPDHAPVTLEDVTRFLSEP